MSAETLTLAHQVATALTVGGAAGWLVFHLWPRDDERASGCAHCPAQTTDRPATSSAKRGIRSTRLRVLD